MNRQSDRLPQGWKWAKLGDVCMVNPRRPTGFNWDPHTKTTFVPMPSVDGQTGAITQPQERIFAEVSRGYTYFEEGDVLFAKITPCMQNGKHAIASGLGNGFGFGSTEFHVLRPSGAVLSEWVHKFLRQPSVLAEAVHHFRGSVGQQRVPKEYLHSLQIPLPPLPEQKRIADLLNQQMAYVEKARKAAEEMLEAAQALPGAFLRQAFPYNLSRDQVGTSNTDNRYFPMVPLGEVAELIRGITFRKSDQLEQATEYSLPIATTKAAQESGIIEDALYHIPRSLLKDERKLLRPGDILISTANSLRLVGRTTHVQDINRPISFGAFMTVIRSNAKILDTYLIHCLRTEFAYDFFSRNATTTTNISNLNFRKLAALRIPLPPLSEQKRIAALLNEQMAYVETVRMSAREQLDAINALPAALLRRAFAGTL